ncbi:MAG: ABC transporter ATP-binding protein, partial [Actinobacteria bacterium]|nr:ABC transporter ATP-binding protein [Actinomycetota bacterium]
MNRVIEIEDLGKKYIISHQAQERYTALRDVIADGAKKLIKGKKQLMPKREEFWALRNINLSVNQSDRVGIIGRNGAGKSTLLKLLSRITEPSEGRVKIRGRVTSLLEVGTGFHPELTGRENIFLNGAILGMARSEIKKKFDEIVGFAEVEKFLDTPVKRYSSGMYVRLAFAVAAHLDSEILIVDEVLAVGDAQFRKKCLGKMDDVSSKEGRAVLFVSHNMGVIRNLCNSAILLDEGKIKFKGNVEDTISTYEYENMNDSTSWANSANAEECSYFDINSVVLLDSKLNNKKEFFNSEKVIIKMGVFINQIHTQMKIQLYFMKHGEVAFYYPIFLNQEKNLKIGQNYLICEIPPYILNEGNYFISFNVSLHLI